MNYVYGTVENQWNALQKRTNMISYSYDETDFRIVAPIFIIYTQISKFIFIFAEIK